MALQLNHTFKGVTVPNVYARITNISQYYTAPTDTPKFKNVIEVRFYLNSTLASPTAPARDPREPQHFDVQKYWVSGEITATSTQTVSQLAYAYLKTLPAFADASDV